MCVCVSLGVGVCALTFAVQKLWSEWTGPCSLCYYTTPATFNGPTCKAWNPRHHTLHSTSLSVCICMNVSLPLSICSLEDSVIPMAGHVIKDLLYGKMKSWVDMFAWKCTVYMCVYVCVCAAFFHIDSFCAWMKKKIEKYEGPYKT